MLKPCPRPAVSTSDWGLGASARKLQRNAAASSRSSSGSMAFRGAPAVCLITWSLPERRSCKPKGRNFESCRAQTSAHGL